MNERDVRKKAEEAARYEMQNAARMALAKEGFTKEALQRQMRELSAHAVKQYMESTDMRTLMEVAVRNEFERQFKLNKKGFDTLQAMVNSELRAEIQKQAAAFIQTAVTIKLNEAW